MLRAFHSNKVASRQYVMGVFPDSYDYLPFGAQDEHHELIVMDFNCDSTPLLINQVSCSTS